MHVIKPGLFVKVCQVPVCTEFGIRMEDTGTGKEPVYQVWVKCNLRVGCRSIKKGADLQVVVKLLEKEVANVKLPAGRDCGVAGLKFFGKVDSELQRNLVVVFSLLIIFSDLLPCIGERVVGYPQKL